MKTKPNVLHPPKGGWESNCYYLVIVRWSKENCPHRALFFSGWIRNRRPTHGAYVVSPGYDNLVMGINTDVYKELYELTFICKLVDKSELGFDFKGGKK